MTASRTKPATKKPSAVGTRGPTLAARLAAWRDLHLYSMVSSFGRIAQRPGATLLTVGVIAVALALPMLLALTLQNVERVSGSFRESREVSLFLTPGLAPAAAEKTRDDVQRLPGVESVRLRTPAEGLQEFREMADFAGALDLLEENPLPAVLVVTPQAGSDESGLADTLRSLPEADFVQHDAQWRARLGAWLGFGRRMTILAAALLGVGVLLVVGNTVRLDIQGRAEEIQTVQLLGATDGFVRRPFLYLGAWYGALAALLAIGIALVARQALEAPVAALVESYGSGFALQGIDARFALGVFGASIALGWLGAWLAAGHHLRRTLPQADAR
jgi:cell division transport system permease protein